MTDALGEALHLMRMSGTFYCRTELTEPWGLTMPDMADRLWFHVLTSGRCEIEVDGKITALDPATSCWCPAAKAIASAAAATPRRRSSRRCRTRSRPTTTQSCATATAGP